MIRLRCLAAFSLAVILTICVAACGDDSSNGDSHLRGTVLIEGSAGIAPLTEAIGEEFESTNPGVFVSVGTGGTAGGFEAFCAGRADIADAAWPMDRREIVVCRRAGVRYRRLIVATDALAVVVNEGNPVDCLTRTQLNVIWSTDSISDWDEVPGLKGGFSEPMALSGPSWGSAAAEYFAEAVHGVAGALRHDYSEVDDEEVIAEVEASPGGIGYLGLVGFDENGGNVKGLSVEDGREVAVNGGNGCVAPSIEAAQDGSYTPLSRPMYLYVADQSLKQPAVHAFVDRYLKNAGGAAESVGFVPPTEEQLAKSVAEVKKAGF